MIEAIGTHSSAARAVVNLQANLGIRPKSVGDGDEVTGWSYLSDYLTMIGVGSGVAVTVRFDI